jgi:Fe-S-cluster-containing dehydrogenase component
MKLWWQTLDELAVPAARHDEDRNEGVAEALARPASELSTRRDFVKVMGLSSAALAAACQRAPAQKILPFTHKPDEVTPGLALWYATACGGCAAGCGLLVKTRDGRPIKIEGNPAHPVSGGAVCAVGQASVLGLYDADRARGPLVRGRRASWKEADAAVAAGLASARSGGRAIRVVAPWGLGPTEEAALDRFLAAHAGARVVRFDPLGQRDAIAAAHQALYGARLVPDYRLDAADIVVGVEADFLGTFLAPAALTRQWSAKRDPIAEPMLRHIQVESALSLTGGAADERIALPPSALVPALARLVRTLAATSREARAVALAEPLLGALGAATHSVAADAAIRLDAAARALAEAGRRGVVICGSDDPAAQTLAALANALLGNSETTAVLDRAQIARPDELTMTDLVAELEGGKIGALLALGCNPALVDRRIAAALPNVPFVWATHDRLDETAALATVHAPGGHFLETWTDHRGRAGADTMGQPCVAPLFDTRAETASLLAWAGDSADDHAFLKARWQREVLGDGSNASWDGAVRDGGVTRAGRADPPALGASPDAPLALLRQAVAPPPAGAMELLLHAAVALQDGTGASANNGWLQELPDPITKVAWGNVAALAPARAAALGISDGDVVELTTSAGTIRLPALRQPGLSPTVVAVAVGHGRTRAGRNAAGHGADAWPLAVSPHGALRRAGVPVSLRRTGERRALAISQTHASQEGRELVRQADLAEYQRDPHAGNERPREHHGARKSLGLWPGHKYEGHRWGLTVDLNKCTGCAACVVSCAAENNIPIVGALEIERRRDMHWLRIDRYYGGSPDAPEVLHQPMMCQHCENAPCETVCPVLATVHSEEGLNQQIYNRCVGTRYCANNCPIKARRFNWFDYDRGGDLARMVLNPDVVVRSRGVMEKCSLCVHRIEEARALSRREGRTLADGDIATACQQSCPAGAITFGDANDPASALSRTRKEARAYTILEEINVKPQVTYMTRIKNRGGDHNG